jgi:hypothetical protein
MSQINLVNIPEELKAIPEKKCKDCAQTKPVSEFHNHATSKDRKDCYCITCSNVRAKRWKQANHQRINQRRAEARKDGRLRAETLSQRYGLTIDSHAALLEEQGHTCKICKEPARLLHVDHCHVTGKVRGILCIKCNTGLGHFRDDVELLKTAIAYLESSRNG